MIVISHRGNLEGPNPELENTPAYIDTALKYGFQVEVDVWFVNGLFFLGHDAPMTRINPDFLANHRLWCHAKNIAALAAMLDHQGIHCFFHQNDEVTLTSQHYIWTFPGITRISKRSVCVLDGDAGLPNAKCHGVCTDHAFKRQKEIG